MCTLSLSAAPIGRMVLFCGPVPPHADFADAMDRWEDSFIPDARRDLLHAHARAFPVNVEATPLPERFRVDPRSVVGAEEQAMLRRATSGFVVMGTSDATLDGWHPVIATSRALAAGFDGVELDLNTLRVLPLDDRRQVLDQVRLTDIYGTMSWQDGSPTWFASTTGLVNLGLPEIWFDGLPPGQTSPARDALRAIATALAAQAGATAGRGKRRLKVAPIELPGLGSVSLSKRACPHTGLQGLRATADGQPLGPRLRERVAVA